jgi:hypothetical protein
MIKPVIIGSCGRVRNGLKRFWGHIRKTFDSFTAEGRYTRNITHNTENTAV